jgi:hypothetical protein
MEFSKDSIRQRYHDMGTDELLKLLSEGGLTNLAIETLNEELKSRDLSTGGEALETLRAIPDVEVFNDGNVQLTESALICKGIQIQLSQIERAQPCRIRRWGIVLIGALAYIFSKPVINHLIGIIYPNNAATKTLTTADRIAGTLIAMLLVLSVCLLVYGFMGKRGLLIQTNSKGTMKVPFKSVNNLNAAKEAVENFGKHERAKSINIVTIQRNLQ